MEKEYFVLYTPEEMNKAYSLIERDFTRTQIFEVIEGIDDVSKQVALIKLDTIQTEKEASILTSVLTGQHGPVREICSAKINQFLKNEELRHFFYGENIREIFLNALNDIIPTVARNILEVIKFLPEKEIVQNALMNRILALDEYEEDETALSNHEIIKKTFKLYWYLETLAEFSEDVQEDEKFAEIIEKTYNHEDYTIREKVSKLLSKVNGYNKFKEMLKNDTNPYVSAILR